MNSAEIAEINARFLAERDAILAKVTAAHTLEELDAMYVAFVGYSIVDDRAGSEFGPIGIDELRQILTEYVVECAASWMIGK